MVSAPHLGDGLAQLVPVAVVGDDEGQLHKALARALLHAHPARRHGKNGIGEAAAPSVLQGGRRGDDDLAGKFAFGGAGGCAQLAQRHAALLIEVAQAGHGAVQVDRVVIAAFANERDHALGLAERVATDDVRAIGLLGERTKQPRRLRLGIGVLEDRQTERRLGDEQVAFYEFEGLGRAVVQALVVAGDDDALALVLQQHLGTAEDVAGGIERDGYAVDLQGFAELQGLERPRAVFAVTRLHDGDRVGRCQNGVVAGACVVGMAVGDDGARTRLRRIDEGIDRRDAQIAFEEGCSHGAA